MQRRVIAARPRIALIGCGDVARRRYLPMLAALGDRVEVAAFSDPSPAALEATAAVVSAHWPSAVGYRDLDECLAAANREAGNREAGTREAGTREAGDREARGLDAALDLTPAPLHATVNQACLDAGLHLYSEKPLAATLAEADTLIATARDRNLLFLCAPGEAVSRRGRWLAEVVASGRFGPLTLAVAHHADSGPATWREYTGDPTVFYGPHVGPVFDHGVYRLHLMTALLGPVRRVQAMGTIALPRRVVRGGPLTGQTIEVTTLDHVLIHLEFASGALGQLLASFATADTLAPWLELHLERGVVSFGGKSWELDAPVLLFDASDDGDRDWRPATEMPRDEIGVVEAGARHFVACLLGDETPILTAEHGRHVLDIILAAYASAADGRAHEVTTTF